MIIEAACAIEDKKQEANELNVFPVPDGDTATNMSLTMSNAINELSKHDDNQSLGSIAESTASALLRGARGNSGVILSLLFRGVAKRLKDLSSADAHDFAEAFQDGVETAYKAV
ncbi:MAG: DAK2 domain-containing protein, partial [Clostridiales bacterium]|nr:DAK2 domain-containing protein [Clostridiales bacterium]